MTAPGYTLLRRPGEARREDGCPESLWLHEAGVGVVVECRSPQGPGHHGACWARVGDRFEGYLVEWWPRHERGEVDVPARVPQRPPRGKVRS